MIVIKRDGSEEPVKFDKITSRIKKLTYELNRDFVDPMEVSMKVISGIYDRITTIELDKLAAEIAAGLIIKHPDYSILGGRILTSALKNSTDKSFINNIEALYNYVDPKTGEIAHKVSKEVYEITLKHGKKIESMIVHDRDFDIKFFGYKTLERAYLLRIGDNIVETPQQMYMRVAIGIWGDNLKEVQKTYDTLSMGDFTHATPTLFNSGTPRQQNSSCFLIDVDDDSITGIYKTLSDCAQISQSAGGIGLNIHKIRAKGSYIKGTGGVSNGITPMLRVFNETARYVDQGGGKRKGSIAIYLEPWHADIFDFIELRKNHGKEENRARDLFLALWTPDLFMERVEADANWTLFCPNEAPGLSDCYDTKDNKVFTNLYEKYEYENKGRKTIKARELWTKILEAQIEGGTPYILYKDKANRTSNQQNIGVIKSSNLCAEIIEFSSPTETAVCNLASVALPRMVVIPGTKNKSKDKKLRTYDHNKLFEVTYRAAINLDRVIDVNYYPTNETKTSNMLHRPIGIGVQGLADVFMMMGLPFESEEARQLNFEISETMYYSALKASNDLAKNAYKQLKAEQPEGANLETTAGAYSSFKGSPLSEGKFQFNLWDMDESRLNPRHDWEGLRKSIVKYGVKNSLSIAIMPTASTSQILGNNECIEAFTSNLYKRNVLGGEYVISNQHLVEDLVDLNLWNDDIINKIILNEGSVQGIELIPRHIQDVYKTTWEMKGSNYINLCADRGLFVCQSQSMNLFLSDVNIGKLNKAHFYGWKADGIKTGMYYLRTTSKVSARKSLGVETTVAEPKEETAPVVEVITVPNTDKVYSAIEALQCSIDNKDDCEACGS